MSDRKAILCVDDEIIILLSLVEELKLAFGGKFVYEQAIDAASALKIVEELSRDGVDVIFVISDWFMPGMKGDEFLEVIHRDYPEIRAILITGQADEAALSRISHNDSVVAIFNKPWNPVDLAEKIRSYSEDD
jgi:CheY-like chemotaxis protein